MSYPGHSRNEEPAQVPPFCYRGDPDENPYSDEGKEMRRIHAPPEGDAGSQASSMTSYSAKRKLKDSHEAPHQKMTKTMQRRGSQHDVGRASSSHGDETEPKEIFGTTQTAGTVDKTKKVKQMKRSKNSKKPNAPGRKNTGKISLLLESTKEDLYMYVDKEKAEICKGIRRERYKLHHMLQKIEYLAYKNGSKTFGAELKNLLDRFKFLNKIDCKELEVMAGLCKERKNPVRAALLYFVSTLQRKDGPGKPTEKANTISSCIYEVFSLFSILTDEKKFQVEFNKDLLDASPKELSDILIMIMLAMQNIQYQKDVDRHVLRENAKGLSWIATAYEKVRKITEALKYVNKAIQIMIENFKEEEKLTSSPYLRMLRIRASCFKNQGKLKEAKKDLKLAVKVAERLKSADNNQKSANNLKYTQKELDEVEDLIKIKTPKKDKRKAARQVRTHDGP